MQNKATKITNANFYDKKFNTEIVKFCIEKYRGKIKTNVAQVLTNEVAKDDLLSIIQLAGIYCQDMKNYIETYSQLKAVFDKFYKEDVSKFDEELLVILYNEPEMLTTKVQRKLGYDMCAWEISKVRSYVDCYRKDVGKYLKEIGRI